MGVDFGVSALRKNESLQSNGDSSRFIGKSNRCSITRRTWTMPSSEEALATLTRIWNSRDLDYQAKLSVRHDWAGLEIFAPDSDEKVVVYSPGDRWVSLQAPDGLAANYFEEGMTDEDLTMWLERYTDAGIAYLEGRFDLRRSPRLRIPHLVIETRAGPVRLDFGLKVLIRAVATRGRSTPFG